MIATEFYSGQGLGNQLWAYVAIRAIATRKNLRFGFLGVEKFKGLDLFDLDFGDLPLQKSSQEGISPVGLPRAFKHYIKEVQLFEQVTSLDVSSADEILLDICDSSKIDGNFQSLKYLHGLESCIFEWLQIKSNKNQNINIDENACLIHVRGGDYLATSSALPASYYKNAIKHMLSINPNVIFYAVTDDLQYCRKLLPNVQIIGSTPSNKVDNLRATHHLGGSIMEDFLLINSSKYLIISSSTFSFWATFLNKNNPFVIAPKYWFAFSRSTGWWSTPDIIIPNWSYVDRAGNISTGHDCISTALPPKSTSQFSSPSLIQRLNRKLRRCLVSYI